MAELDPSPVVVTPIESGDKVYFDWQQPGWDKIIDWNKQDRINRAQRALSWGRQELVIPEGILHFLKKAIPELDSPDAEIKTRAWKRFAADPVSLPFRVHESGGALARSFGGLDNGRQSRGTDGTPEPDVSAGQGDGPAAGESVCGGPEGHAGVGDEPAHLGDA